jgi:hypothetical protein
MNPQALSVAKLTDYMNYSQAFIIEFNRISLYSQVLTIKDKKEPATNAKYWIE